MGKSPGHRKWPDHKVEERHLRERMQVEVAGRVVADSTDVIRVEEDEHPNRHYFPRSDVNMDAMERTDTTTECPFKGTAHYYSIKAGDTELKDAAWTYDDPYEEHSDLKDRVAFYDDKMREIDVRPGM